MVFRRRRRDADADAVQDEATEALREDFDEGSAEAERAGPWDAADLDAPYEGRIDFGALLIPAVQGMQVRVEAKENRVTAIGLVIGESTLQVVPFAAPRSAGIWDEVRAELKASIAKQGGTVDEAAGPFGPELGVRVPSRGSGGRTGTQQVRFLGVDGPRWFLRGMITGRAVDRRQAGPVEQVFRQIVVVRGGEPMAPRDAIPLRMPKDAQPNDAQPNDAQPNEAQPEQATEKGTTEPVSPFERGPEITEVR